VKKKKELMSTSYLIDHFEDIKKNVDTFNFQVKIEDMLKKCFSGIVEQPFLHNKKFLILDFFKIQQLFN
jgi:hypothetical protein